MASIYHNNESETYFNAISNNGGGYGTLNGPTGYGDVAGFNLSKPSDRYTITSMGPKSNTARIGPKQLIVCTKNDED